MSDGHRRSSRSDVSLWLRRNAWLVAAVTFMILYGVFMVRTTMWAHVFGAKQEQEKVQESGQMVRDGNVTMSVLKEMGTLRDDHAQKEVEEQVEEAVEDGREQLVKGEGKQEAVGDEEVHNAHAAATTGRRVRPVQEEDTVAYDDNIPLEDAGDIPMVGATAKNAVEAAADAQETKKDYKWTAFDNLSIAGEAEGRNVKEDEVVAVPSERDYERPTPSTAVAARTGNDSDHLWTRVDKLPEAGEAIAQRAPGSIPTVSTGSVVNQYSTLAAQISPSAFTSRRFDKSRFASEMSNASIPFEKRHHTTFGYNATIAYLQLYTKPADSQEELFLFFTCSDNKGDQDDWTPNCAIARKKVYDTFAKSPSTNRLLTIYTGSREYWTGGNAFTDDDDIRLKAIPTLMRWDSGAPGSLRSTWGVLVDHSILYDPLLRYLFRSTDEQDKLLGKPDVETKDIVTLRGYAQYRTYMENYARNGTPYPMYMMMVSGRLQRNNRLWCPWCRQSEMPVEYAFYAYAPTNAKLVIVETYDKYSEWRNPENEFKKDPQLAMKGVPWFYRVYSSGPGEPLTYERIKKKFYVLEALQQVFKGSGYSGI